MAVQPTALSSAVAVYMNQVLQMPGNAKVLAVLIAGNDLMLQRA